jgi:hypothetical protein
LARPNSLESANEKKLQRSADRAAHKAAKTEQHYDEDHNTVSNSSSDQSLICVNVKNLPAG